MKLLSVLGAAVLVAGCAHRSLSDLSPTALVTATLCQDLEAIRNSNGVAHDLTGKHTDKVNIDPNLIKLCSGQPESRVPRNITCTLGYTVCLCQTDEACKSLGKLCEQSYRVPGKSHDSDSALSRGIGIKCDLSPPSGIRLFDFPPELFEPFPHVWNCQEGSITVPSNSGEKLKEFGICECDQSKGGSCNTPRQTCEAHGAPFFCIEDRCSCIW